MFWLSQAVAAAKKDMIDISDDSRSCCWFGVDESAWLLSCRFKRRKKEKMAVGSCHTQKYFLCPLEINRA